MPCGNNKHIHPCSFCKHVDVYIDGYKEEPCIECKGGNCQYEKRINYIHS